MKEGTAPASGLVLLPVGGMGCPLKDWICAGGSHGGKTLYRAQRKYHAKGWVQQIRRALKEARKQFAFVILIRAICAAKLTPKRTT